MKVPKTRVCGKIVEAVDAYEALHNVCDHAARGEYASHARRAVIMAMECMSDAFPEAVDEFYEKQAEVWHKGDGNE